MAARPPAPAHGPAHDGRAEGNDDGSEDHKIEPDLKRVLRVEVPDPGRAPDAGREVARVQRRLRVHRMSVVVKPVLQVRDEEEGQEPESGHGGGGETAAA